MLYSVTAATIQDALAQQDENAVCALDLASWGPVAIFEEPTTGSAWTRAAELVLKVWGEDEESQLDLEAYTIEPKWQASWTGGAGDMSAQIDFYYTDQQDNRQEIGVAIVRRVTIQ